MSRAAVQTNRAATPLRAALRSRAKGAAFSVIRSFHRGFLLRDLPDDAAIYFHRLDESCWEQFAQAVTFFRDAGYATVSARGLCDRDAQSRRLFISFDDNFADWHRALGLFDRLGVSATFYVNTLAFRDICDPAVLGDYFPRISHDGSCPTLSRSELREIAKEGHVIGCHSHSHFKLSALPRDAWDAEIRDSKTRLEDLLGQPVTDFSYPYGMRRHFSNELRRYCAEQGFETIATGRPGLQHVTPRDPLCIHRTGWKLHLSLAENLENLRIDGRLFEGLTGRSTIG